MPSQYNCGPVKDDGGWHIPYNNGKSEFSQTTHSVLCLRCQGHKTEPQKTLKEIDNI